MHSTKNDILALLKRADGSTVDALASSLGLAPMTVRQHLVALERDALVAADAVRRPTGRPHYVFRLSEDGHRRVLDGYDRLVGLLVQEAGLLEPDDIAGVTPQERRARLFSRAATALANEHAPTLRSLAGEPLAERLVVILRSYGGFPEWHAADDAIEFRDYACVFRSSVPEAPRCAWHESFLEASLGHAVRAAAEDAQCIACCRYLLPAPDARRAEGEA